MNIFPNSIRSGYTFHIHLKVKVKVRQLSRVGLSVTPWIVAQQVLPSMGFSRQEYWSGLPFPSPGDLPSSGIEPASPALQADALTSEPPGIPPTYIYIDRCNSVKCTQMSCSKQKPSKIQMNMYSFALSLLGEFPVFLVVYLYLCFLLLWGTKWRNQIQNEFCSNAFIQIQSKFVGKRARTKKRIISPIQLSKFLGF